MAPLISVLTPCLNAVDTLPQALASVRDAGLGPLVEHVVVDGGSTDGTLDVLRSAEGVRWTSEPDRGLSDAMNKGIAAARGTFIGWLNADDYYLDGALARVVHEIERDPGAVWLTAPCVIVDHEGHEIRRAITRYKTFLLKRYSFPSLLVQNFIAAPATFADRRTLEEAGGFDERFKYSMDYDVWLRLARRADPVVIESPLTAFRMAEGSLSMSGFERQFDEHMTNAREHGAGHRVAVVLNGAISRGIVLVYRILRMVRQTRPSATRR
jgi:glycosyltransferase involved in cell wall biosynthesis